MDIDLANEIFSFILGLQTEVEEIQKKITCSIHMLKKLTNSFTLAETIQKTNKNGSKRRNLRSELEQIMNDWDTSSESHESGVHSSASTTPVFNQDKMQQKDPESDSNSCVTEVCLMGPNNMEQNYFAQWQKDESEDEAAEVTDVNVKRLSLKLFNHDRLPTTISHNTVPKKCQNKVKNHNKSSSNNRKSTTPNKLVKNMPIKKSKSAESLQRTSDKQSNQNNLRRSTRVSKPVERPTTEIIMVPSVRDLKALLSQNPRSLRKSIAKQTSKKNSSTAKSTKRKSKEKENSTPDSSQKSK